jgi:ABC-type uncharacterized transport system substrate-binding protein
MTPTRANEAAAELIGLGPDVVVVNGTQALRAAQRQTQRIPIVFVMVGGPVASGLVENLVRPDGRTS